MFLPTGNVQADARLVALTYESSYGFGSPSGAADAVKTWLANIRQGDAALFTPTAWAGVDGGLFAPAVVSVTVKASGFLVGRSWSDVLAPVHAGSRGMYSFTLKDARVTSSTAVDTTGAVTALEDVGLGARLESAAQGVGSALWKVLLPVLVVAGVVLVVLLVQKRRR